MSYLSAANVRCIYNMFRAALSDGIIKIYTSIVKLQWLEHLWDPGNLFERWVVRANEF